MKKIPHLWRCPDSSRRAPLDKKLEERGSGISYSSESRPCRACLNTDRPRHVGLSLILRALHNTCRQQTWHNLVFPIFSWNDKLPVNLSCIFCSSESRACSTHLKADHPKHMGLSLTLRAPPNTRNNRTWQKFDVSISARNAALPVNVRRMLCSSEWGWDRAIHYKDCVRERSSP